MSVAEQVESIIRNLVDVDDVSLDRTTHLRDELGITSIERVELITALENEFDIDIRDTDVLRLNTLGDVIECIEEKHSAATIH
jgi:acyl carrier protein